LEETLALAVDADHAGNEIGLDGLEIPIALRPDDEPVGFQFSKGGLEVLLLVGEQIELPQELGYIGRRVTFPSEQF
jgi:hypothetical protein